MQSFQEQSVLRTLDRTKRTADRQQLLRKLWVIRRQAVKKSNPSEDRDR
jgi:hypothetical protein